MDGLPTALARANALQAGFLGVQEAAMRDSIDLSPIPASRRQADIILDFLKDAA